MSSRSTEIVVGLFVALGIAALLVLALQVSNLGALRTGDAYTVTAHFDNIGGLTERAPVTAAGVTVGRVIDIQYDNRTYTAQVTMAIQSEHDKFPRDTNASIYTSGLLGEQYIALGPGADTKYLRQGGTIQHTQSAVVLEELIGQFLYDRAQGG